MREYTAKANRFYASAKWKKCRTLFLTEHPFCERCLQAGRIVPAQIVHHKIHIDSDDKIDDPMLALNPENLEALCLPCHDKEHYKQSEVAADLAFDADGNLIRRKKK